MTRYRNLGIFFALVFIFVLAFAAFAHAATSSVSFAWNANTEPDLAGYRLWQGPAATGPFTSVLTVGKVTTATLNGVVDGTHYFVLTAYDTVGNESGYSNSVWQKFDTIKPGGPTGLVITVVVTVQVP
jgi:endoglucanase